MGAWFLSPLAPALAPVPQADDPHPFGVDDLLRMERVQSVEIDPAGARAVVVVQTPDRTSNKLASSLWLVDLQRGGARRMTSGPSDRAPRFAADGRTVWFLSSRSGSNQVWSIPVDGGEATQVTHLPVEVGSFAVAVGGTVVVGASVFRDAETLDDTASRILAFKAGPGQVRTYDRLMVRHWDTWADGRQTHLVVVPPDGPPRALTTALDADVVGSWVLTPDRQHAVFSARPADTQAWTTTHHLYRIALAGGAPVDLTPDDPAWSFDPKISADGTTLWYRAMRTPGYESDRWRLVTRPVDPTTWTAGPARWLTEDWDRSPSAFALTERGDAWAIADDVGQVALFHLDGRSGRAARMPFDGAVQAVREAGGRVVLLADDLAHPAEVFTFPAGTRDRAVRASQFNDAALARTTMGRSTQITFPGAGGDLVHAWVTEPVAAEAPWPVALVVHGGPQGSAGDQFSWRWNRQVFAGAGYATIAVDFHGSTGYGQAFTDAITGDWGGKPLEDLDAGLAAALDRFPSMDPDRVAALGASYGGYMMYWLAGQRPDRFRCFVAHDGVISPTWLWYDTEELFFPEHDHLGTPWDSTAFGRHDPLAFVDRWKAPMLVIQGEKDFRVTTSHSLAAFGTLQRRGIPSRLLVFPEENHWVTGPTNSATWYSEVLAWLDRWTADR